MAEHVILGMRNLFNLMFGVRKDALSVVLWTSDLYSFLVCIVLIWVRVSWFDKREK